MTTAAFKDAASRRHTSEIVLVLLEISHPQLSPPIRVTSDGIPTTHNGNEFEVFPYDIFLPVIDPERQPNARLEIDNVSRKIVSTIRQIPASSPLSVRILIVKASDPDTIEEEWEGFELTNVRYNALKVSGDLTLEDFLLEPYPKDLFTPANFPGGFA